MVVLGVVAGLLTSLSWAVNGLLATGSATHHAATAGHNLVARHGSARHATGQASPSVSPSHRPAHHKASQRPHVSGRTSACAPGGVTLTVSSAQGWYQPGSTPRFTVRAVSTESQPCRFNMGPRFVAVVIDTSAGRSVWSSADCVTGSGSDPVVLASGTHAALRVSWDRKASSPGCGAGYVVRPGEYRVAAVAGAEHSKGVNIVLGAKGASGP
jgi:hypothetical protein